MCPSRKTQIGYDAQLLRVYDECVYNRNVHYANIANQQHKHQIQDQTFR